MLSTQLEEFAGVLREHERPVASWLRPGLSADEVEEMSQSLAVRLPEEGRALYRWKDGSVTGPDFAIDEICIFPNYFFPPLRWSSDVYRGWLRLIEENASECMWNRDWFPLFQDAGGCFYALDGNAASATYGKVLHYTPDNGGEVAFSNLSRMICSLCQCYRHRAFLLHARGHLTQEDKIMLP